MSYAVACQTRFCLSGSGPTSNVRDQRRTLHRIDWQRNLLGRMLDWHGINWSLERNEKNTSGSLEAVGVVGQFCGAISVSAGLQCGGLLAVVCDPQFTGHQDHTLGRCVPVLRNSEIRWHPKENVRISFCWIPMKHRNFTSLRNESWTGAPFELSVGTGQCKRRLRSWCLRECDRTTENECRRPNHMTKLQHLKLP
jgi:hypothetical protein